MTWHAYDLRKWKQKYNNLKRNYDKEIRLNKLQKITIENLRETVSKLREALRSYRDEAAGGA